MRNTCAFVRCRVISVYSNGGGIGRGAKQTRWSNSRSGILVIRQTWIPSSHLRHRGEFSSCRMWQGKTYLCENLLILLITLVCLSHDWYIRYLSLSLIPRFTVQNQGSLYSYLIVHFGISVFDFTVETCAWEWTKRNTGFLTCDWELKWSNSKLKFWEKRCWSF